MYYYDHDNLYHYIQHYRSNFIDIEYAKILQNSIIQDPQD